MTADLTRATLDRAIRQTIANFPSTALTSI